MIYSAPMNAVIVGAGVTGMTLAKSLIEKGNNVILIEQDEETARHAANRLDCMVINDRGNKISVLFDAGIERADVLIVVTESDEVNLITCGIVESLSPDILKIARVRNPDYLETFQNPEQKLLGVDKIVFPDEVATTAIVRAIEYGAVSDVMTLEHSDYEIVRFSINKKSILNGVKVCEIQHYISCKFVVVSIEEDNENIIPSGNTVLKPNAKISILLEPKNIRAFYKLAGLKMTPLKKIAVVGMGRIGTMIVKYLFQQEKISFFEKLFHRTSNRNIIIVEKDEAVAKKAAEKFPRALVYNSDIMNEGFIEETALNECDLVITVTQNYELNMIASTLLKNLGVDKTITLVQSPMMESIADKIGIDVVVSYKGAVVDAILSHISGKNVTAVHTIGTGTLEILEITISQTSPVLSKPIKDFSEHGVFLLMMIERNAQSVLPNGTTELEVGDRVVVICRSSESRRVSKMMSGEQ